jgi:bifunctional UDP-N-acetylglucosamine pyrophosphorylase/glucosamine-1-phosphate N-acetyltransferase
MISGMTGSKLGVVILAAGEGKRMRSNLPKGLNELGGKPILFHILECVRAVLPKANLAIVVGHGREKVEAYIRQEKQFRDLSISFIHQNRQLGTGHAVKCAMESPWGLELSKSPSNIVVLPGDFPLLTSKLIEELLVPFKRGDALRLLTCDLANPTGYGRIIRRGKFGSILRIVEEKDASPKEKRIREVATSIYLFSTGFLKKSLEKISDRNAQGEYYLTDLVEVASKAKKRIDVLKWADSEDLRGVNDQWELAQAAEILNIRTVKYWATQGVRVLNPSSIRIDVGVKLEEGVVLHPGAILLGETHLSAGSVIGPFSVLKDVEVGKNAVIKVGTVAENSAIGANSQVGPYAHLRPETEVGAEVKVGNFVELKKTKIGTCSSIAHLSYLGDAEVGRNVNIGCGFITCNFDGRVIEGSRKHRTVIEDGVFMGSDCQTVAPVRVGKGAFVASGSTVTEDVPPEALAIGRSRQVNKPGYARKFIASGPKKGEE